MTEEIKRRNKGRRSAEKVALNKSGMMNEDTRARMLHEVRMRAGERRRRWEAAGVNSKFYADGTRSMQPL